MNAHNSHAAASGVVVDIVTPEQRGSVLGLSLIGPVSKDSLILTPCSYFAEMVGPALG